MIIGNLGGDPEMRYTGNGDAVTTFSVAVNRRYTSNGEQREEVEWFRVVTWRRLAEACAQYLSKGRQVYVEGRLQTRTWEQDGQKHYMTELVAQEVKFLGGRQDEGGVRRPASEGGYECDIEPDDLPF